MFRRTGAWYQVIQKPSIQLAIQLATHIAEVQPGVSGRVTKLNYYNYALSPQFKRMS